MTTYTRIALCPRIEKEEFVWTTGKSGMMCSARWRSAGVHLTASIQDLADVEGLRAEYLNYHGFGVAGIDYAPEVDS